MRIQAIEAFKIETHPASRWLFANRSWVFVVCTTECGHIGCGEASQSRDDDAVVRFVERWASSLVGNTPADVMALLRTHLADAHRDRPKSAALSAIEQAMWDLIGKRCGAPVSELLGGRMRSRVPLYANIGYAVSEPTPECYAATAVRAVAEGFAAVKIYPYGPKPSPDAPAMGIAGWLDAGEARIAAVRAAIGPDVLLLIDLMHEMPNLALARDAIRRAMPYAPYWIEDPFPSYESYSLRELKTEFRVSFAGGAPLLRCAEFVPVVYEHLLDVVMPDVKWIGGIREARLACDLAAMHGVEVSLHSASGPVSSMASAAIALGASWPGLMEYAWGSPPWRSELCRGSETIESGHLIASDTPGLGVDLDIGMLRKLAATASPDHTGGTPANEERQLAVNRRIVST